MDAVRFRLGNRSMEITMTGRKVWLITGAGRGLGVYIARAALAAGNAVVATGRNREAVTRALGDHEDLLAARLDITNRADAEAAVASAVERFGRIDVLVNNAGNFNAGFFEELTPEQMDRQLATTLVGPMNVTRAVLPVMRRQRAGHVITISSSAGLTGFEFGSAYAASKFGLEGWMESLRLEIAPFGIHTTIVNPGFFRTELLTPESTRFAETAIDDYAQRRAAQIEWWTAQNGRQSGDPSKLAAELVEIADEAPPRRRFIAGADSIASTEQKVADLQADIDLNRERFTSLDIPQT
jgi:NAD(P)-dependent dehydrogenase (short-subunit alcohol dehydrogenase family)